MTPRVRQALLALVLCASSWSWSCSAAPDEVDRVQPNLLDKRVFEGEWWYASTVIDTQYDEAFVVSSAGAFAPYDGAMSTDYGLDYNRGGTSVVGDPAYSFPIARVRFVIDEHYLFAYRAFELTLGGNEDAADEDFLGQPLAVFKIEAHVDVRKEYDPVTGEKNNVTSENTSDRRWFERKLVRVDWSQNLLSKFVANDVQSNELFTQYRKEPVPFFFQGGAHPEFPASYAPAVVTLGDDPGYARKDEWPKGSDDVVHYLSFVTQEIWSPGASCLTQGGVCASVTATTRNSFLRVPPEHEYASRTVTHREFDRFGIFRSHQPTYAAGGQDGSVTRTACREDVDCGAGGACDNAARREAECLAAGERRDCRAEQNICVGGLTDDRGETDFLAFFASRHNFYADSLTEKTCAADWECDGRYVDCSAKKGQGRKDCLAAQGSVCDAAAKRCTVPEPERPIRPVVYRLSPHFPPYLVRRAFDAVAQWNEALMRGRRASRGLLPIDQALCGEGKVCTTDLAEVGRTPCQSSDPTAFCYCGAPEEKNGTCRRDYDPFESPKAAKARGVPNPYDCYVKGPDDEAHPTSFEDYAQKRAYDYAFVGEECLLTLAVNSCDADDEAACEELGDLRHHFLSHIQHGGAPFAGVAAPLSDPTSGELVVSNATVAAESLERVGTLASQLYPVLRGEASEDAYFSAENVRGYFARAGKVEHPVATVAASSSGNTLGDPSRPLGEGAALSRLEARLEMLAPKLEKLRGEEGRAAILSDRKQRLAGTQADTALAEALAAEAELAADGTGSRPSALVAVDRPAAELAAERKRRVAMAARNIDVLDEPLYGSQYHRYFAEAFRGRPLDEASLRMQQAFFTAVTLHELGHALGLRHNFAASLDRDNYADGYFALATQLPLPSYLDYDDPARGGNDDGDIAGEEALRFASELRAAREERLLAGAGNTMTSSVMDYSGDLSDVVSLGRYDRAAVLWSYFSKVEAYETADPTDDPSADPDAPPVRSLVTLERPDLHRRTLFSYYRGGDSCQSEADCPHRAGRESTAYQPITQRCVRNPRLLGEADGSCATEGACVCSSLDDDLDAYAQGTAYRNLASSTRYEKVDYLYCHDNRVTDLSWCTPFDAGESFQEVVEHHRRAQRERYPSAYFRNFRASGPARGASYGSVVDAVKIYQHLFFRMSNEGASYRQSTAPRGFYDQLLASAAALDFLAEIIGAPDVGSYRLDEAANVYRQIDTAPGAKGADLSLRLGEGYHLWSEYQTGQNGFGRLERAGTFLDKLLAIQAIAKRDWGLAYQVDELYYVSFLDLFEPEVIELFGGLILRDPRAYAPRVRLSGGEPVLSYLSAYRGFSGERENQDTTYPDPAVDGTDTEVLRDIAAIEALSNFPVYYDTSFEQRLLIWKLGSGDGYTIPSTRPDGTPTCKYGDAGCTKPDYIVYDSDRLHTSYVAVVIDRAGTIATSEQQLSYELLRKLSLRQARVRTLAALAKPTAGELRELGSLGEELARDESFVEYLIELERALGISSAFF